MNILVVTWFFPPANTIGGVRLAGMVRHLLEQGDDVRVIAPDSLPYPQTLPCSVDERLVLRTPNGLDPTAASGGAFGGLRAGGARTNGAQSDSADAGQSRRRRAGGPLIAAARRAKTVLDEHVQFPDRARRWIPGAVAAGRKLRETWRPDVVFASGPPFSTLIAAERIARPANIPLVCEFRDRWWDDPYYPPGALRRLRERMTERRICTYANALTTVSEPWAETYRARYAKPVQVVYNGFDEADGAADAAPPGGPNWTPEPGCLNLAYTGTIYPGRRDPSPLFAALADDPTLARRVRVSFFGTAPEHVHPMAERYGVGDSVAVWPAVSHAKAAQIQRAADALLLMQWNDPRERGNVPGKFFEYLGAGRPVLLLGLADGVPHRLLRERDAGVLANAPTEIADALRGWLAAKDNTGQVAALPAAARTGFSRTAQFEAFRGFLHALPDTARPAQRVAAGPSADLSA